MSRALIAAAAWAVSCAALVAVQALPLPFWVAATAFELLVIVAFGVSAALIAGRELYRIVPAAILLTVAISVEYVSAWLIGYYGPQCGSPYSELSLAVFLVPAIVRRMHALVIGVVVFVPLFAYATLARRNVIVRLRNAVAFLVAVGGGLFLAEILTAAFGGVRCPDF